MSSTSLGLRLERPVDLHGGAEGERIAGKDATIVGHHRYLPVRVYDVNRPPLEEVAVLAKGEVLGAFANHGVGRKDEAVRERLDGHFELGTLTGSKSPQAVGFVAATVLLVLVWKSEKEVQR